MITQTMVTREDAILMAVRRFVDERTGALEANAGTRMAEIETLLIQQRDELAEAVQARAALEDEIGRLRAELAVTQAEARAPVEAATRLVRSARQATSAAEDALAVQRRWARDFLLARARSLAA